MTNVTDRLRTFLTISPSVVFPDEVLELFEPVEAEVTRLSDENKKLRELALKNWYIALSERHALKAHDIDPDDDAYIAVLDDAIAIINERMQELGIEVSK